MELSSTNSLFLPIAIFLVALLYSSVGHGGASGYLAIMAVASIAPAQMSSTALILNVLVAGIAWWTYSKAGHFRWSTIWPFLITSIPAAFIGSLLHVSNAAYFWLLAAVLLLAAFRLVLPIMRSRSSEVAPVRETIALPVGAGIGLFSGIVGVGGGIFLSPLMILMRWADTKTTSAAAACFVVINSLTGLAGRGFNSSFDLGMVGFLPIVAFAGGIIGANLGANLLSSPVLRKVLAGVLLLACVKLVANHLA